MVRVEWHADAVEDLIKHDSWRRSHGWEPIGGDLMDAVTRAGARDDIYPWQRCRIYGEVVPVLRTSVEVRGKRFFVYFLEEESGRRVRRILHPKGNRAEIER